MVAAKTSDDLLDEVKVLAQTPPSDPRVTDAEMLELGSHALSMEIADLFLSCGQARWVYTSSDVATIASTALYRVPSRALASGLSDLLIIDSSGEIFDAPEIPLEDHWIFVQNRAGNGRSPYAYSFEGDHVRLAPTPADTSYSIRYRWPRQPARLVTVAECAKVATAGGVQIVCDSIPSTMSSPLTIDVVEGTPHGDVLMQDTAATFTGSTFTVSAVDSEVADEDYVCPVGTTCVPPIPESVWPFLVAMVAQEVIDAYGDGDAFARAEKRVRRRREMAVRALAPRNRGETPVIINRHSALRGGRFTRGLGRG